MRVLIAVNPAPSIFHYLVPLAWALRTAGHDVRVASSPCLTDEIVGTGLTAVPVGRDAGLGAAARSTDGRPTAGATPEAPAEDPAEDPVEADRAGVPEPYDAFDDAEKVTWEYLRPRMAGAVRGWHWLDCSPMMADLVALARRWRPDLVVWDPLTFAGPVAAKAIGAAHVRVLFGADVVGITRGHFLRLLAEQPRAERTDPFADWLGGYGRKYGFDFSEDMVTGQLTVDPFPASLRDPVAGRAHLGMQPVPAGRAAAVPEWLQRPPRRPRVALTLGLSATEHFTGYTVALREVVEAIATLDVELVATVAESQRHLLPTVPDNVRVVSYVPWHALVPTCAAVVHHGGAATLAATARHPVPQLALHYHFDQPFLARKLAEQGAGLEIHTSRATGVAVRDAVRRLLTEPRFGERARALADEVAALPTPHRVVARLEELAAHHVAS